MLKNISKLECKINERTFIYLAEVDSPLHDVKEALFQFVRFVGNIEENSLKNSNVESEQKEVAEEKPQE